MGRFLAAKHSNTGTPASSTATGGTRRYGSDGHPAVRVQALTQLGPYLPEPLLRRALEIALAIEIEHFRVEALSALEPHLTKLSSITLYPIWINLIHQISLLLNTSELALGFTLLFP